MMDLRAPMRRLLRCRARTVPDAELLRPALVFAPHPDDECLGCGGTVLRLRAAGVPVGLVFLTDGRHSHSRLMAADRLAALRAEEARAAASALGIAAEDVHLLGFEDSRLADHVETARARILDLLRRHRPEQVFVPYHADGPADHIAAHRAVLAALADLEKRPWIREYPVWFWNVWPWTRRRRSAAETARALLALFRDLNEVVDVRAELPGKRTALACHRSQMTALRPDADWPTLPEVEDGDWLDGFFSGYEFFCATRW